ncbi:LysM domain-containing protein [Lactiplantibacillus plantarum]|nr:LysM domain-containing protein [Lactiplantibacillus plantarum]
MLVKTYKLVDPQLRPPRLSQQLKAATKGTYAVKAGDTLWALADKYNTSVHALRR